MAFGSMDNTGESAPMAEINMIPLIDVMLVLLVIFIITAPLLPHAVKIDLPKASSSPAMAEPKSIRLAIKAGGEVYWNQEQVDPGTLASRMADAAGRSPQPEIHLRADRTTEYQKIVEVMSTAARAGLIRIGFVTDPASAE